MTVLEGFAHGRPIIGADIGGIPELIDPNIDGLLFEPENASALATKSLRCLKTRSSIGYGGKR